MTKFYVYEHWRPDIDVCFYVGKGCGARAASKANRNVHHARVVAKLERSGMCVEVRMFACGLTEVEALSREQDRIAHWRSLGVALVNQTAGGDGMRKPVPEVVERMKKAAATRWADPEARRHAAKLQRRTMQDAAVRARISASLLGRSHAHGFKIGLKLKGRDRGTKFRKRMSGASNPFYGKTHTPEALVAMLAANVGRKASSETRAKMRAAQQARRKKERC